MITKQILVIDDEKEQAEALKRTVLEMFPDADVFLASKEDEIEHAVAERFYNLVLLDIKLNGCRKNGIDYAKQIIEVNPFAKIIFVSGFLADYTDVLNEFLKSNRVLAFSEKKDYEEWKKELEPLIRSYYEETTYKNEINRILLASYANAKNEPDTYKKGVMFEDFVSFLFRNIGFKTILKRVKDRSLNEVDLIVRNDIDDNFLTKFGKYVLVECKNRPGDSVSKNDYIVFKSKLDTTNHMAELGFLVTTSKMAWTAYQEAMRDSHDVSKIVFIDDRRIFDLINAEDMKEKLKEIIDSQVKDN